MESLALGGVLIAVVGLIAVVLLRTSDKSKARRRDTDRGNAPWSRGEVLSLVGILVGAAIGVAGFVLPDDSSSEEAEKEVSAVALAALVRQGPFTEVLPMGLKPQGLVDVNLGESSAAGRVDALELRASHTDDLGFFAHLEIYPTADAAIRRAEARIETIERIYEEEGDVLDGGPESYCAYMTIRAPIAWECGGTAGLVFAEATVTPNANAYQPIATGTVSAILRYTSEKARLAAES